PLKISGIPDKTEIPEHFSINIDKSSQFLSALMIAAGTFGKNAVIDVVGSHGLSYVDLTAEMIRSFGVSVVKEESDGQVRYLFDGKEAYRPLNYQVEPDMSAAAYFYAMAAVLGTEVAVHGVTADMLQGDTEFFKVLEKMGCELSEKENKEIAVKGPEAGLLRGNFTIDMSAFSDQALTLAAIAPFADGPISIEGIGHIRLQECDRIHAITSNLRALGIKTEEKEDAVTIYPGTPAGCDIETFEDHRVAMSFALTGLRTEGVRILNPDCCRKTFAEYFQATEALWN
ncbi:MAG: 3-phosphoshikimate 1-carboxyvinyltransferase, partial [Clostridiales bacterium]|nr:3-phosphoshikimate 1-carboxyvinyltransferase [Candidatus Blautia equi]